MSPRAAGRRGINHHSHTSSGFKEDFLWNKPAFTLIWENKITFLPSKGKEKKEMRVEITEKGQKYDPDRDNLLDLGALNSLRSTFNTSRS